MIQDNLFNYKRFAYLKSASLLALFSGLAYLLYQPEITSNGGTWLGYGLGTLGALLILWLMWLGVRKRQYGNESGNLRAWVSAHIYLGLALAVIGTLHTGFQIGWNVHSLAYVFMMATIASGAWGLVLYIRLPQNMSDVLNKQGPEAIADQIASADREAGKLKKNTSSVVARTIELSLKQPIYGKSIHRFSGKVPDCNTEKAVAYLQSKLGGNPELSALYQNQVQRLRALKQLRHYFRLRLWLELWLAVHVPLSFGLLAALVAHVVSVFFYW